MRINYTHFIAIVSIVMYSQISYTQVGIGTTTPGGGAILDVDSSDKGILMPRVNIINLNTIAPVTGGVTTSLLVYNTNVASGVGFYYWSGSRWIGIDGEKDWKLSGNAGTTAGIHFLGTTDNQDLVLKTNSIEHLRVNHNQTIINENSIDHDFRVESNNEQEMFLIDSSTDRIGIKEPAPAADLHLGSTTGTIRIESLNSTNNTNNNGIDPAVVMVDANGDLFIRDKVDDFPIDASDTGTGVNVFMAAPIALDSPSGNIVMATAYTTNITITRTTLIEVAFWTSVNIEVSGGGTYTTDRKPRLFGGFVTETGAGTDIVYSANSYTNAASTGTITTGLFTVGGNGFITLPAGTHTIELVIFTSGGEDSGEGVRATFGANTFNRFQIVYHN